MELKTASMVGTLESSDIMVSLEPGGSGIEVELKSTVEKQYGAQIRSVITQTLAELGAGNVRVHAEDRGALDCTIRARVAAAFYRAAGNTDYKWGE